MFRLIVFYKWNEVIITVEGLRQFEFEIRGNEYVNRCLGAIAKSTVEGRAQVRLALARGSMSRGVGVVLPRLGAIANFTQPRR